MHQSDGLLDAAHSVIQHHLGVVQLIAEGYTNKSIGSILKLSIKTVETHRASAMHKLRMSTTAELVRYAIRKKLVEP